MRLLFILLFTVSLSTVKAQDSTTTQFAYYQSQYVHVDTVRVYQKRNIELWTENQLLRKKDHRLEESAALKITTIILCLLTLGAIGSIGR